MTLAMTHGSASNGYDEERSNTLILRGARH
jgi:hypothetical protein